MSNIHTRTLKIGYHDENTNKYDIYSIPEYIKLIIGDETGQPYEPKNYIYLAINIITGETNTFHTVDCRETAENYVSGRENDFHLLECKIDEYLAGHDKIESHIISKYEGNSMHCPEFGYGMAEITTELVDISSGDTVFVCPYLPKYRKQYYKEFGTSLPDFAVTNEKDIFTSKPDEYELRGLAELEVN